MSNGQYFVCYIFLPLGAVVLAVDWVWLTITRKKRSR